eukprot:m.63991 g.63991  ORF g.63991 m.63991 type:complete len:524 (-) comp7496_c0_seq2:83-1654(-)
MQLHSPLVAVALMACCLLLSGFAGRAFRTCTSHDKLGAGAVAGEAHNSPPMAQASLHIGNTGNRQPNRGRGKSSSAAAAPPPAPPPPPRSRRVYEPHPMVKVHDECPLAERPIPHIPLCASKVNPATVVPERESCPWYTREHAYPEVYREMDCRQLPVLEARMQEKACKMQPVPEPLYIHTYYSGKPFRDMEYVVLSYLMTQDLEKTRFNFWTDAATIASPDFAKFMAIFEKHRKWVNFLVVDVARDAEGTCMEGKEHFIDPTVDDLDARIYSDLIRILVLKHYGGLWVDIDMIIYRDVRPLIEYFGNFASAAFKDEYCITNNNTVPGCWNNAILSVRPDTDLGGTLLNMVCALPYRSWMYNKPHPELKPLFGGWTWNEGLLMLCALNQPECFMHALRKAVIDPVWGSCTRPRKPKIFGGGMSTAYCRERDDLGPININEPPPEMFFGGYTIHTRITQCGKEGPQSLNHPTSLFSRIFARIDHYVLDKTPPLEPIPMYPITNAKWLTGYKNGKFVERTGKLMP